MKKLPLPKTPKKQSRFLQFSVHQFEDGQVSLKGYRVCKGPQPQKLSRGFMDLYAL